MPPRAYTDEQLAFLQEEYQRLTVTDLAVAFNKRFKTAKSVNSIKACLYNHKITCGGHREKSGSFRKQIMNREQFEWVKARYRDVPLKKLVEEFNSRYSKALTVAQLRAFLSNHGIRSGRDGRFEKGQERIPSSGGMKPGQTNSGSFHKGHTRTAAAPMYSERIDTKDGYILIKVPGASKHAGGTFNYREAFKSHWARKHVWVWEQEHGPIPDKHCLIFMDNDRTNCDLDNLRMIHRRVLSRLNHHGWREIPLKLRPTFLATIMLEDAAAQRAK